MGHAIDPVDEIVQRQIISSNLLDIFSTYIHTMIISSKDFTELNPILITSELLFNLSVESCVVGGQVGPLRNPHLAQIFQPGPVRPFLLARSGSECSLQLRLPAYHRSLRIQDTHSNRCIVHTYTHAHTHIHSLTYTHSHTVFVRSKHSLLIRIT